MRRAAPIALALLAGCAALKPAEQPMTLRLSPPPPPAAATVRAPGSLAVAPVQARGLAGALRYDYVDAAAPAEIRQAKTVFWEEPPTRVVERALVAGLRTRFAAVAGPELGVSGDRRVVAVLTRFEEASAGGAAQAVVAFDATLTGTPPTSGRYCARAPITDAAGTTRAHAFEAAIELAVAAFVQDAAAGRLTATDC